MSLSATDRTVREIRTTGPNLSCMARMFRNLSPRDRIRSECVPAPTICLVVLTCGHKGYRVAHMGYRSCARWGFPAQLSAVPWLLHIGDSRTERLRCIADTSITKWNGTYDCPPTCCNSCESDSSRFGVCVLDKLPNMIQGNSDRHWSTQGCKEAKGKREGKVKCGIKSKILWQRRRHALCKSNGTFELLQKRRKKCGNTSSVAELRNCVLRGARRLCLGFKHNCSSLNQWAYYKVINQLMVDGCGHMVGAGNYIRRLSYQLV